MPSSRSALDNLHRLQRIEAMLRDFGGNEVEQRHMDAAIEGTPLEVGPPEPAGLAWWQWLFIIFVVTLAVTGALAIGLTASAWWHGDLDLGML